MFGWARAGNCDKQSGTEHAVLVLSAKKVTLSRF